MTLLKSDARTLQKGDKAPQFNLKNVDNNMISLSNFKDKILVIVFMCNHCPYVIPKMDELTYLQDNYKDKDVVVIGINSNDPNIVQEDDFEHMQELANKKRYNFYLFDETQQTAVDYGATCTPDPFVFDKEHKLVYHGRLNNAMEPDDKVTRNDMREVLDKLINKEEIEEWFVPSQGCSIKWKN